MTSDLVIVNLKIEFGKYKGIMELVQKFIYFGYREEITYGYTIESLVVYVEMTSVIFLFD